MRGNHDADPWSQPCPCPDLTPSCLEMHDPSAFASTEGGAAQVSSPGGFVLVKGLLQSVRER